MLITHCKKFVDPGSICHRCPKALFSNFKIQFRQKKKGKGGGGGGGSGGGTADKENVDKDALKKNKEHGGIIIIIIK